MTNGLGLSNGTNGEMLMEAVGVFDADEISENTNWQLRDNEQKMNVGSREAFHANC